MPDEPAKADRRILVIEDDQTLVELFSEALEMNGYRVDGALTIEAARHLLAANHYAVILCDIQIGEVRSLDFLREALPGLAGTQVIVVSGMGQSGIEAAAIGVDFFLSKPVDIYELVTLVDRLSSIPFSR